MPKPALTVLTDPIPYGSYFFSECAKKVARKVRNYFKPPREYLRSMYRGHFAVTRSLVEGLEKIGASYNYNPARLSCVAETVVVLASVPALRQAIELKRAGNIKRLLAGPNLVMFPSDYDSLLCAPEVDVCITPGPLTCDIYVEDCPTLAGRCQAWPAGVDTNFWTPDTSVERRVIVVYDKPNHGPTDCVQEYVSWLRVKNYEVHVIQYGLYTKESYRDVLRRARLMIGFSGEESQGIAWAEAWATDVPTFMWYKDKHSYNHPRSTGRTFTSSPAPYLCEKTGRFFKTFDEFKGIFGAWESGAISFTPRQWTITHMSDEVCARLLCELSGVGSGRGKGGKTCA